MAAKPMSKTKTVAHIAEKLSTPKKTAALFFEELFKLAGYRALLSLPPRAARLLMQLK